MRWETLDVRDVVVIPAHNEEASIGLVVRYVLEGGFLPENVLVVDSGCTDRTVLTAIGSARACSPKSIRVISPHHEFIPYECQLVDRCGVAESALHLAGKGTAMYAAALALTRMDYRPDSRVFFLDGDITNPSDVDPIGCLLRAWEAKPDAHIAKLASVKRENEGILAFCNLLPPPYNLLSNLAWPLCGQQSLRLYDLQGIPFPTDYSVEVALLAALVELYGSNCFTQEPIAVALAEEQHADDLQRVTRMFTRIMLFLQSVVAKGPLYRMTLADISAWNRGTWREVPDIGVPSVSNGGVRETLTIDTLLPPVTSLVAL